MVEHWNREPVESPSTEMFGHDLEQPALGDPALSRVLEQSIPTGP